MSDKKNNFCTYEELKLTVQSLNIKTKDMYVSNYKTIITPNNMKCPINPRSFYGVGVWENWSVFLGKPLYKKNFYNIYYSYEECLDTIKKLNIKSKTDYYKNIKNIIINNNRIPYNPHKIYHEKWKSWGEFLGTGTVQNLLVDYLTFEDARNWSRLLNFKIIKEWRYLDINKIPFNIPKKPERHYKNKGWVDYYDWLGIDKKTKMSYGEKIINDILLVNNISFKHNRSLLDCSNISKLRFDFYLPKYNICIEYDGIQHFKPIEFFGGEIEFEKTKIRDEIKNLFCKVNDLKLIRVNYCQSTDDIYKIIKKELGIT